MYETEEEYRALVATNLLILESACGCTIRHGAAGFCPRCGEDGFWDIEGIGFGEGFGNSIYYSTVFHGWRCSICDFMISS